MFKNPRKRSKMKVNKKVDVNSSLTSYKWHISPSRILIIKRSSVSGIYRIQSLVILAFVVSSCISASRYSKVPTAGLNINSSRPSVVKNETTPAISDEDKLSDEEMSYAEHKRAAKRERAVADLNRSQYRRGDIRWEPVTYRSPEYPLWTGPDFSFYEMIPTRVFNPSKIYKEMAAEHMRRARKHESEAAILHLRKIQQCTEVEQHERKLCPLRAAVEKVEKIEGGVRLYLNGNEDPADLLLRVQCHISRTALTGNGGMPECGLFIDNLQAKKTSDANAIDLTGPDSAAVAEIRERFGVFSN